MDHKDIKEQKQPAKTPLLAALSLAGLVAVGFLLTQVTSASEPAVVIPAPAMDEPAPALHTETAVFAGGCFWGVQGVFQHVRGVSNAVSGYSGGNRSTAVYEVVSGGNTGHAESVQVTFDPTQITYGRLLQIFFSVAHNPTELNFQGPDHGTQYRSALFPTNDEQRKIAAAYVAQLDKAKVFGDKIVTRIETFNGFYPAETYHQNFLVDNPHYPYIVYNDLPKVDNLKKVFPDLYRTDPVLVKTAGKS